MESTGQSRTLVSIEEFVPGGNIFAVLEVARRALTASGRREDATEMIEQATSSGSYGAALAIVLEYIAVE